MDKYIKLIIECDNCNHNNEDDVKIIPTETYKGTILKSFWCKKCRVSQCVRYKFVKGMPKITERIDPNDIYKPRKQASGLTIKPRGARIKEGKNESSS